MPPKLWNSGNSQWTCHAVMVSQTKSQTPYPVDRSTAFLDASFSYINDIQEMAKNSFDFEERIRNGNTWGQSERGTTGLHCGPEKP